MNRSIIITDLTRFKPGSPNVCTAGIDPTNGECIRPKPYLTRAAFEKLNILPGGILTGEFKPDADAHAPHIEDHTYGKLTFGGAATSDQFKAVLDSTLRSSVESGFGQNVVKKSIPCATLPVRSIITLKVDRDSVQVVEDGYAKGKIRLHFTDPSGREFSFLPITDLGFHEYALKHHSAGDLSKINRWIRAQREVYLRIGLGQPHENQYWLQANGIYTFPEAVDGIRGYED